MKQQERQAHSRREILTAAMEEFGSRDYAQVNMENICKNHRISKGMMYHYYSNKDELFLLCVEDTFNALKEYVVQHKDRLNSPDIPERIRDYFMLREYFFQLEPKRKQIFETAMLHPPKHLRGQIQALREPLRRTNQAFLEHAVHSRILRPGLDRERVIRYLDRMEAVFQEIFLSDQNSESVPDLHALLELAGEAVDLLLFGVLRQEDTAASAASDAQ